MTHTNVIKCRFCNWMTRKYGMGSNPEKAFAKLFKHIEECHEDQYDLLESMRKAMIERELEEVERINGTYD